MKKPGNPKENKALAIVVENILTTLNDAASILQRGIQEGKSDENVKKYIQHDSVFLNKFLDELSVNFFLFLFFVSNLFCVS